MRAPPEMQILRPGIREQLRILTMPRVPVDFYAYLYDRVGRPHHWTSRRLPPDQLAAEIHREGIAVHVLYADSAAAGWFELDTVRKPTETRLVHFGLLPEFRGRGIARWFLGEAVSAAFAIGRPLVTLETNTLDHPAALKLYKEAGFRIVSMRIVSTRAIDA